MPVLRSPLLAALPLSALLAGCAAGSGAATTSNAERVVSGSPTFLQQTFMTMDARCRPVKRPTGVLTDPPRHGKVRMATRSAAAEYGPGDHEHCDGKLGPSLAFEYTSRAGYRGPDGFDVRIRYNDGEIRHARFAVEVD